MLEAQMSWSGGRLYVNTRATPVDWDAVRAHLDAAARLLGADEIALELVITNDEWSDDLGIPLIASESPLLR